MDFGKQDTVLNEEQYTVLGLLLHEFTQKEIALLLTRAEKDIRGILETLKIDWEVSSLKALKRKALNSGLFD